MLVLIIAFVCILIIVCVMWFCSFEVVKEHFISTNNDVCSANLESIDNLASVYNKSNLVVGNLKLQQGQISNGQLSSAYPTNLGLYSTTSEGNVNIFTNSGSIDFRMNGTNEPDVFISPNGTLTSNNVIYAETLCIGPPSTNYCFTFNPSESSIVYSGEMSINGNINVTQTADTKQIKTTTLTAPNINSGSANITNIGSANNRIANVNLMTFTNSSCDGCLGL